MLPTRRSVLRTAGLVTSVGFAGAVTGRQGRPREIDGPTVIDEPGQYRLVQNVRSGDVTIDIRTDHVTFDGQRHDARGNPGIRAESVDDLTIKNVGSHGGSGRAGFHLIDVDNARVQNLTSDGESGALVDSSSNSLITQSIFRASFGGIGLRDCRDVEVRDCLFDMDDGVGISRGGGFNTIRNNVFSGNMVSISLDETAYNTIRNNEVYDSVGAPVWVRDSRENNIRGNTITSRYGSKASEIYPTVFFERSDNNSLLHNEVMYSDEEGIFLSDSSENYVAHNSVCFNDEGDIVEVGDSADNVFFRNRIDCTG